MDNIFDMLHKPALWRRSEALFWDDEHISKHMLEAHLNPDWDAASRRRETIEKSVRWISSMAAPGGKILDLGCGPGLYCSRLSDMGFDVTGMDFSMRSIEYAKNNDKKSQYIYQNYLDMDYDNCFDIIIMIYCDYAALIPSERELILSKVYKALKPGGIFIFDVFTDLSYCEKNKSEKTELTVCDGGGFWSAEPYVLLETDYFYENDTVSVNQNIVIKENSLTEYLIWDTVYDIDRLESEISSSGLQIRAAYDDACGSEYTGKEKTLCLAVVKPGGDR